MIRADPINRTSQSPGRSLPSPCGSRHSANKRPEPRKAAPVRDELSLGLWDRLASDESSFGTAMVLSVRLVSDLRLIQRPLRRFSGGSMELHGFPSGVELLGAGFANWVAIPTNEGYRNLPITNEPMPLSMRSIGCARRMGCIALVYQQLIQVRGASAPRLRVGVSSQEGIRTYLFPGTRNVMLLY